MNRITHLENKFDEMSDEEQVMELKNGETMSEMVGRTTDSMRAISLLIDGYLKVYIKSDSDEDQAVYTEKLKGCLARFYEVEKEASLYVALANPRGIPQFCSTQIKL